MIGPDHYRYRDVLNEWGQHLVCETYQVIKETPCGYFVVQVCGNRRKEEHFPVLLKNKDTHRVRFVLKGLGRRWCYPEKRHALQSFAKRKESQIGHAETSLAKARHAMAAARKMLELGNGNPVCDVTGDIKLGMPPEFAGYSTWY